MKRIFVAVSILLLAFVLAILAVRQRPIAADVFPHEDLTVDGATRSYRLVVPHTLTRPAPIVFAFHGLGDSPESMADYSRLDQLAARNGFILVYPAARKFMWETVDAKPDNLDPNPDVRFFDQLLAHLSNEFEIDRNRVYAVGMSNGATFVQLFAIARSKDIAAIAAHSGSKPSGIGLPTNPRPILLIAGANDPVSQTLPSAADQYRSNGHVVEVISVPGLGHEWSTRHNAEIWNFLSRHSLDEKR